MREQAVRRLDELNEITKAQQAFLNSCSDATWITDEQRYEIRWLLSALIDHRRRVRVTARLWRTLTPTEQVGHGLVAETTELIDENGYFAPLIERWRSIIVARTTSERKLFWFSMMELAERNLSMADDIGETGAATGS